MSLLALSHINKRAADDFENFEAYLLNGVENIVAKEEIALFTFVTMFSKVVCMWERVKVYQGLSSF